MSAAYYIVPEKEIEGFDHFVNGKYLCRLSESTIGKLCAKAGVKSLLEFLSFDLEEMSEFIDEDLGEEGMAETRWFQASEGLETVKGMKGQLIKHSGMVKNSEEVIADLVEYENVLSRLAKEELKWYLTVDY